MQGRINQIKFISQQSGIYILWSMFLNFWGEPHSFFYALHTLQYTNYTYHATVGIFRLLAQYYRLKVKTHVCMPISSADVRYAWAEK